MLYNCTFYIGTGFNSINIPYDPQTLMDAVPAADEYTVPQIELLQARELTSFNVATSYDAIKDADYCKLTRSDNSETVWFAVNDVKMTSPDVCTVYVTLDYILTAGGCGEIDVLDGITERHHVPLSSDTFGAYTEPDNYLVPSDVLEIDDDGIRFSYRGASAYISSTVDLVAMGAQTDATAYIPTNGTTEVSVPDIVLSSSNTHVKLTLPDGNTADYVPPNAMYFNPTVAAVKKGIEKVRALGIESCITNQWSCPTSYSGTITEDGNGRITEVNGLLSDYPVAALLFEFANVNNKRVLYGELCKYGIVSVASGNKVEFTPEDIYHAGDVCPKLRMITDVRPDGKPYFRFQYYKNSMTNFWANCIQGLEWANVPLMYTDKSGVLKDGIKFVTEQSIQNRIVERETAEAAVGNLGGAIGNAIGMFLSGSIGDVAGAVRSGAEMLTSPFEAYKKIQDIQEDRVMELSRETQAFELDNMIVAPEVNFPRSECARDYLGNGVYIYRYRPTNRDVQKFDKILSMYGYKCTEPLTSSMFNVRSKFSYVRANGVSVKLKSGNKLPRWIRNGIAEQFRVGVRIWKVKPDPTSYSDGSNT